MFPPKKSTSVFLYCNLSKFHYTLHFLAVSGKAGEANSWSLWFCCLPTIIISSVMTITCLIIAKHWPNLCWHTSPATVAPNGTTVNLNLQISVLKVVKNDETSSSFRCQYPFLQSHTVIMQASTSKWAMSLGLLQWYGSLMVALFRLVGSMQMCQLQVAWLVLAFYKHKLLIQGVASSTGLSTSAHSILSTSCLNTSVRWIGVCLGVTLGSSCIWWWRTQEAANPFKYIWVSDRICSMLVTSLGTAYFCLDIWAATSCIGLWADTFYFCTHNVAFVFLGWSADLVIKLALGGKQSDLVLGCIEPSINVVLQNIYMLPSFTATKNVTSNNIFLSGCTK